MSLTLRTRKKTPPKNVHAGYRKDDGDLAPVELPNWRKKAVLSEIPPKNTKRNRAILPPR